MTRIKPPVQTTEGTLTTGGGRDSGTVPDSPSNGDRQRSAAANPAAYHEFCIHTCAEVDELHERIRELEADRDARPETLFGQFSELQDCLVRVKQLLGDIEQGLARKHHDDPPDPPSRKGEECGD